MISIVGSGRVGSAIAFLCVSNSLDDVLLVNRTKSKAVGESLDIVNAIPPTSKFSIHGTDDYSQLSGSDVIVIAASTDTYLMDRTENMSSQVIMIQEIAKKIKQYCPSSTILLISNPLDVLTYFFQKKTKFSRFKVFGIASNLDTSRFRYFISEKFSVPQSSINNALVIGEHGDSMVPIFSKVCINGNPISFLKDDKKSITNNVRNYWKILRKYKSRSQFGIAKNAYDIISTIICKKEMFVPVSMVLDGEYGEKDVAIGVPVKINQNGINKVQYINFDKSEQELFKISVQNIRNNIQSL